MANKLTEAGTDAFWKAMPWIFLVLGICLLAVAFFAIDRISDPSWHGFLVGVASLILSAGVFAVLLKSYQYIQIFNEELLKVFSQQAFRQQLESVVRPTPSTAAELRSMIEPLVERYAAEKQKDLADGALKHLRHVIDAFESDGLYRTSKRTIHLKSYDSTAKKLKIEEEFHVEVVPKSAHVPVRYRSTIRSANSSFEHGTLLVNGKTHKDSIKVEGHTIRCNLDLVGSDNYMLLRTYNRTLDLRVDPYMNLRFSRPVRQLYVKVINEFPDDLNIIVQGVGFDGEKEGDAFSVSRSVVNRAGGRSEIIELSKSSLTLNDEGYLIIFGVL
jgi:hypothetical protein